MKNLYPNISSKGLPSTTFNMGSEHKSGAGFTLIEVLVALGVFSIVVSIAVGGFVNALKGHRQSLAIMAANSNISYAIEQIAREIRTGQSVSLSGGGDSITFNNSSGGEVTYYFDAPSNSIYRSFSGNAERITDDNVIVDYLRFTIYDFSHYPPRVSINIGIRPKVEGADTGIINFQTTVSSRNF